jgi:hypothetical protein
MAYKEPFATSSNWGIMRAGTGLSVSNGIVSVDPTTALDVGYFFSTTTQTNPVANAINIITANGTTLSQGVTVVGGTDFTVSKNGNYTFTYVMQMEKLTGGATNAEIRLWVRLNGADVANSTASTFISNATPTSLLAANYTLTMTAGQYLQIAWVSDSTNVQLLAVPAQVGPPAIPSGVSVRVTLLQV